MSIEQISATYHAEWFAGHDGLRAEYRLIGEFLHEIVGENLHDVIDVGCGRAYVIERLQELGYEVYGVDGSTNSGWPASIHESRRVIADLTDPDFYVREERDLVICTEVAEHLPSQYAQRLVDIVSGTAACWIYFTAATPGQGGYEHVNEQPQSYWLEKFARRGWVVDAAKTEKMLQQCQYRLVNMPWFGKTSLILRPQ